MKSSKKIIMVVGAILIVIFIAFIFSQSKTETVEGLEINVVEKGVGDSVKTGDSINVHYVGKLEDGKVFDSSRDRNKVFNFTVGDGDVIKGWEKGVIGMKVGEIRVLTISPELGYGSRSQGPIPPNSTLIFEIELLSIDSEE